MRLAGGRGGAEGARYKEHAEGARYPGRAGRRYRRAILNPSETGASP